MHETEDVVIEMRTKSEGTHPINVFKDNSASEHKLVSQQVHVRHGENFNGWEININDIADSTLFINAMTLITAGKLAYNYMDAYGGLDKSLVVYYPANSYKGSQNAGKFIHINRKNDQTLIETFTHEFGHFVAYCLKFINLVGGEHSVDTNNAAEKNNKLRGLHLAWNEGFAEFFSGYVINKHPAFKLYFGLTDSYYMGYDDSSLSGESNELSVQRFLSIATYHSELTRQKKFIRQCFLSDAKLWSLLKNKRPKSIDECVKFFKEANGDISLLGEILSLSRIAPYDLNVVDNQIQFSNAGVQNSKKSRLDKFIIHVDADGKKYQYAQNLEQLISLKDGKYGFYFNEQQIKDSFKNKKKVDIYVEGVQSYGIDTGPYTSELYSINTVVPLGKTAGPLDGKNLKEILGEASKVVAFPQKQANKK